MGIQNLLDRKPKQLSGGQRQRVAVGRAIVRKPPSFSLTNPFRTWMPSSGFRCGQSSPNFTIRLQTTIIYVTHDQVEAMTMGTKIVVMKDGLIQQIGSPLEVYNFPVNLFVAGFIGSPVMNFIPCRSCSPRMAVSSSMPRSFQLPVPEKKVPYYQAVVGIRGHLWNSAQRHLRSSLCTGTSQRKLSFVPSSM